MKNWTGPWGTLELGRFPVDQEDTALQAWNGADRLLAPILSQVRGKVVLVLGDTWGALTCLAVMGQNRVINTGDSWMSHESCRKNLARNGLDPSMVEFHAYLDDWTTCRPDLVILQIPRNLDLFAWVLEHLHALDCAAETPIYLAALDKDLVPRCRSLAESFLGPCIQSPGNFKAHCLEARLPLSHLSPVHGLREWPLHMPVPGYPGITLANWPGVFSRDGVDPAGLFLLGEFFRGRYPAALESAGTNALVVDLGCGNGLLALAVAQRYPLCRLLLSDESAMAIASAREGFRLLSPDVQVDYRWTHALEGVADSCADLVLCNPPFHVHGVQSLAVAAQLFADARRVLKAGGKLLVVANRHLGHHRNLLGWFDRVDTLADNGKFVVLCASGSVPQEGGRV